MAKPNRTGIIQHLKMFLILVLHVQINAENLSYLFYKLKFFTSIQNLFNKVYNQFRVVRI